VQAEYGHVAGARDFFARLAAQQQREDAATGRRLTGYFDTHPRHADRVAALQAEAAAHGWVTEGPLTPWPVPRAE
jgi:Zn-dependent protease with chaperone function